MRKFIIVLIIFVNAEILQGQNDTQIAVEGHINNAPFEYVNEDGDPIGFCIDITDAVMTEIGKDFSYTMTVLRNNSQFSKDESIDLRPFSYCIGDTDEWFFSDPYLSVNYNLIHKKSNTYKSIEDLVNKKILVIVGDRANIVLFNLGEEYLQNISYVSNIVTGLEYISSGKADVLVVVQGRSDLIVGNKGFDNMVINDYLLPTQKLCFASRDSSLINDINKSINTLVANNTFNMIYKKWFEKSNVNPYAKYIHIILFIFFIVTIILVIFLYWQKKKIKTIIKDATVAKKCLIKYAELTNRIGNSHIKIFLTNVKKEKIYILKKDEYEEITGDFNLLLTNLHPDDRELYEKNREEFINGKKDSAIIHVRIFDIKYNLFEVVFTDKENDHSGNICKFYTILRNVTLQDEMLQNRYENLPELNMRVQSDDSGSPSEIYEILRDVSNLLPDHELLYDEISLNKIMSEHVLVGIGLFDKEGLCKRLNNKALEYIGFNQKQVVGKVNLFSFEHLPKEAKDKLHNGEIASYKITSKDIKNAIYKDCEITDTRHDKVFSVNCSPVFNNNKKIIGYISTYTDITEVIKSRENINELQARVVLALDAGEISASTYNCEEETYLLLNNNSPLKMVRTQKELLELVLPDDRAIIINAYKAIQTRQSDKETFVIRTLVNNKLIVNRFSIIPCESKGKVKHIIGVVKDISEKVKAELNLINANNLLDKKNRELNLNNQLLKEIINQMPGVLFIKNINSDLKYYMANTAFCQIVAHKAENEVIGFYDYDIFPKEVAEQYRSHDFHSIKINSRIELDEDVMIDGKRTVWRTIKTPISLTNDMKLLICMSIDVTEIYRIKEKAVQSDVLKSQFLANMSHELRTPLNAIVGFSHLLVDIEDKETKKEFNEIVTSNSELLLDLINDILDLSKMESGVVTFNDEFFNVNEFLDEAYSSFKIKMQYNVTLECVKLEHPWSIKLDNKRFKQVLNNFLSNAIKYTPRGEIVFGCKVEQGGIKLFVKDTGIGIAKENKNKIFGRFEKVDTFAQGTGLGLSICKAFADLKQGKVGFNSAIGRGSYFWIWIPCEMKEN